MSVPKNLKYTATHEWAAIEGKKAKIGLTDHAQHELGDLVFITLPAVGKQVTANATLTDVESVKAVSEIISPVSGKVIAVNNALEAHPESINSDPYGAWICEVEVSAEGKLMSASEYETILQNA